MELQDQYVRAAVFFITTSVTIGILVSYGIINLLKLFANSWKTLCLKPPVDKPALSHAAYVFGYVLIVVFLAAIYRPVIIAVINFLFL